MIQDTNRIILPIRPVPWMQFFSGKNGSSAYWFIPEDCRSRHRVTKNPEDEGKPCDMYLSGDIYCGHFNDEEKWVKHTLSKQGRINKAQIERYNKYRMDVFHLAKKAGLVLMPRGQSFYYHFPIPKRWNKAKRAAMHGQDKISKPDTGNLTEGLFDALTGKDEQVAQRSGDGKFWFDPDLVEEHLREGFIEIVFGRPIHNPYNVNFDNQVPIIMEDIETRRAQKQAKREAEKIADNGDGKKHKPQPLKLRSMPQEKLFKKKTDELK